MAHLKEISKDLKTAADLEHNLQVSAAQNGVAVLDVYSAEWGTCRAITETFRRLLIDEGDAVHLRFFTVECHSIIESLKSTEEQQRQKRQVVSEALRDTTTAGWLPILEKRAGLSKPYFVYYKEGKLAGFTEGVDTPSIRAKIKDLCTVKVPASTHITNPKLLEVWEEYFQAEESEVSFHEFIKALVSICKLTVSLSEEEKNTLSDSLGVKDKKVTAAGLQAWVGDDEARTIMMAFTETLPDYEERAVQVRLEREADEKRRQEEEEKQKAEEEKAEEERKEKEAEEKRLDEEAKKEEATKARERVKVLDGEIAQHMEFIKTEYLDKVEGASIEEDEAQKEIRAFVAADHSADPPHTADKLEFVASEEAAKAVPTVRSSPMLYAAVGEAQMPFFAAYDAIGAKVTDSNLTGHAKLALALMCCDSENAKKLGMKEADYLGMTQAGTLMENCPGLAMSAICLGVFTGNKENKYYFLGEATAITNYSTLAADAVVTLPPLTLLATEATPAEGKVLLEFTGLDKIIDLTKCSMFPADKLVATHWFAKFKVTSHSEEKTELAFEEYVEEDEFTSAAAEFSSNSKHDEALFDHIHSYNAKRAEHKELNEKYPPEEQPEEEEKKPEEKKPEEEEEEKKPEEKKPATPSEEKKPEEKKPATPSEEKKPEEQKPSTPPKDEKPKTPPVDEEKPEEEKKPATPPTEEKPATPPQEEKPATPAEPEEDKTPEEEEKPVTPPTEEKPATPAEEEPEEEEKPATPPTEETPPPDNEEEKPEE